MVGVFNAACAVVHSMSARTVQFNLFFSYLLPPETEKVHGRWISPQDLQIFLTHHHKQLRFIACSVLNWHQQIRTVVLRRKEIKKTVCAIHHCQLWREKNATNKSVNLYYRDILIVLFSPYPTAWDMALWRLCAVTVWHYMQYISCDIPLIPNQNYVKQ